MFDYNFAFYAKKPSHLVKFFYAVSEAGRRLFEKEVGKRAQFITFFDSQLLSWPVTKILKQTQQKISAYSCRHSELASFDRALKSFNDAPVLMGTTRCGLANPIERNLLFLDDFSDTCFI